MSWITTVPYHQATGRLKRLYDRIKGPDDTIDNIMLAHSLRPHTMEGHMALYKHVLHHNANALPVWFLETVGVYVSLLNDCFYCVEHHFAGLKRLLKDDTRVNRIATALATDKFEREFTPKQAAGLTYAATVTRAPGAVGQATIDDLRAAGYDDGEILELNQVTAYFAYANRTVLGLGIITEGDILGLSPGQADDPDDWSHR